jgi:hypothetical protein
VSPRGLPTITRLLTYQAGRSGAFPALLASARSALAGYPLNGRERLVTTKIDAAASAGGRSTNVDSDIYRHRFILAAMDEPLLSERFSKMAEGIRALARSERYQETRRMMLAIAADYDFLAKRAAVAEDMLTNEEPSSVYHTG